MTSKIYSLLAIVGFSVVFFANTSLNAYAGGVNFTGPYLGTGIGLVMTNVSGANNALASSLGAGTSSTGLSSTKTAFAFDFQGGYDYNFNPVVLGAGVFYINNSNITANGTLTARPGYVCAGTGTKSCSENLSYGSYSYGAFIKVGAALNNFLPYAKLGISSNKTRSISYTAGGVSVPISSSSGSSPLFGLGIEYLLTKSVALNAEWDHVGQSISLSTSGAGLPNVTLNNNDFLIGINYYF